MTNSSAQDSFSITLNDTIDLSNTMSGVIAQEISTVIDTVVLDYGNMSNGQSITLPTGSYDSTITIDSSLFENIWVTTVPFENGFPEWEDFQKMCKEYPGLEQAYEKLKTFYVLCKDEWETKKKEQK